MRIVTCTTVDDNNGRATTVHGTRAEAVAELRRVYRFDDLDFLQTYTGEVFTQEDLDNLDDPAFLEALDFGGVTVDLDEHQHTPAA